MAKESKKTVTVADLISVIGLAVLAFFTFMGAMFKTGGVLSASILYAVGITLFTWALVLLLKSAKTARSDQAKFKVFEILLAVAYIALAVFGATFLMRYFSISTSKDEYISYFKQDVESVNDLFTRYESQESEAISKTGTGLRLTGYICDATVKSMLSDKGITANDRESINTYVGIVDGAILKGDYEYFKASYDKAVSSYLSDVQGWAAMKVPFAASGMEDLALEVAQTLTEKSSLTGTDGNPLKFNLVRGSDSVVHLSEDSLVYTYEKPTLLFQDRLRSAETTLSIPGLAIAIVIHLLVLISYFSAYRSKVVRRKGKGYAIQDGGINLYE